MIARVPLHATKRDLEIVSEANPGWQIELEADGTLVMSPTGTIGGARSAAVLVQLATWNAGRGLVFDSDTGFEMPDKAVLCPDAAWISNERWAQLTPQQREGYAPVVPDVVVEIVSKSDRQANVRRKAARYIDYGARYVVVIDPYARESFEFGARPDDLTLDVEAIYSIL